MNETDLLVLKAIYEATEAQLDKTVQVQHEVFPRLKGLGQGTAALSIKTLHKHGYVKHSGNAFSQVELLEAGKLLLEKQR